jgi:hypothetical protein
MRMIMTVVPPVLCVAGVCQAIKLNQHDRWSDTDLTSKRPGVRYVPTSPVATGSTYPKCGLSPSNGLDTSDIV